MAPAVWRALAAGQALSVVLAGTGVCSQLLARASDGRGLSAPAFQNWLAYATLVWVYGTQWALHGPCRNPRNGPGRCGSSLQVPWYAYAAVSLADVLGNLLAVLAYRFTNITSVTLLDCFAIPVVMVLSRFALRTVYQRRNVLGVGICLVGLVLVVLSDSSARGVGAADAPRPVLGDALAVLAAFFYGAANVAQEALVKRFDRVEFLFMLGLFGFAYTSCVVLVVELDQLQMSRAWADPMTFVWLAGYVLSLCGMYAGISFFLERYDAALLNLSLLSSDVWAVLAGFFIFGETLLPLYFVALAVIVVGVAIYHSALPKPQPSAEQSSLTEDDHLPLALD